MAGTPFYHRLFRAIAGSAVALLLLVLTPGCINIFAMSAKMLKGEPTIPSAFQRQTGEKIKKGERRIAIVCDAPYAVIEEYGSLSADLQEELQRTMKRRGMVMADERMVMRALEGGGGGFNPETIAREAEADIIIHVQIEGYADTEPGSPNMHRGRAEGMIRAFATRGERGTPDWHVIEAFQQEFRVEYPSTYPVPADQTPKRIFQRRFLDQMADEIGRNFYNVTVAETI